MMDWTEYDAVNLLALAVHRWRSLRDYGDDARTMVYSNGTEHGFAAETAELILDLGPMLRRALFAGIREIANEPEFEGYLASMAAGDHEAILAAETAERAVAETR